MGMMEKVLRLMGEKKASDVYIAANTPIQIKINGLTQPVNAQPLPVDAPLQLLAEIVTPEQLQEFESTGELNIAVPPV